LATHPFEVFLLNTGRVGGAEEDAASKKIAIEDSGAIVEAIAEGTIQWERDPDFGYEVASSVPGLSDVEKLQPRRLYERTGRADEYAEWVEGYRRERLEFLEGYPGLEPEIIAAIR
jgi:phosphoenolpyruvate carboxykinase (ATP)